MARLQRPHITPLRGAHPIFAPATVLVSGTPITNDLLLAGCGRWRIRIKATAAGTLSVAYYRPGTGGAVYTANNPTNVAVSANVETLMEETAHMGEEAALVTFTPSGNGTLGYCDLSTV